jgi:hypothetical protein
MESVGGLRASAVRSAGGFVPSHSRLLVSSEPSEARRVRFFRGALISVRSWCLITVALFTVSASVGAASAFGATVAAWQMNEPPGSTTMTDASGSNLSGTIGSAVLTGVVTDGATGYRWLAQNKDGLHPERLVIVESPLLNPGSDDFAVTVRLYTGAGDQNILQKGQAKTVGGMFKIDMLQGQVICMYKGSAGRAAVRSTQTIWDNAWHTVRCERRSTGVTVTIDGGPPKTTRGPTGNIANTWEFSIGGKSRCNPPDIQCDYFVGRIDSVIVERLAAGDTSAPLVQVTSPADGSVVPRGKPLTLDAAASDNVGVTKVEFRVNGSLKCTLTAEPYTCSWTPWTASGTKNTIRAIAYDAAGNTASHTIFVHTQ